MPAQTALALPARRPAAATATDRRQHDDAMPLDGVVCIDDTPLTVGLLRELLADAERRRFMPGGLQSRPVLMLLQALDDRIGNQWIGEYAA